MRFEKMNNVKIGTLGLKRLGIGTFVQETKSEIKKIKWCTRKEVLKYTRIVIFSSLIVGFMTYFADVLIRGALSGFHLLFKLIF
jgi:preprotein translocase subunit SecE